MLVRYTSEVKQSRVETEGAKDVKIRWLISKEEGAPNFAMREFEVAPGGYTPYHSHAWEHEVFILEGEGVAVSAEAETTIKPGMVVFVPGGEMHNFKNTGSRTLRFLCLVPHNP